MIRHPFPMPHMTPNYDRPEFDSETVKSLVKPTKLDRVLAQRQARREEDAHERRVNAEVDARDKGRCRCCERRGNPNGTSALDRLHRAHIVDASLGGPYESYNLLTLCPECHLLRVHGKQLFILGMNANEPIEFEILEAAVVHVFGHRQIPKHVSIITPDGERRVEG